MPHTLSAIFFIRHDFPSILHSFPTRRSSDLDSAVDDHAARADHVAPNEAGLPGLIGGEDRKSTRLNSSHVAISYAVFCLKKKQQGSQERRGHAAQAHRQLED